jgi:hypothetical protein
MSHARAVLHNFMAPSELEVPSSAEPLTLGAERRTERRFTPTDLHNRLVARHKYGEPVTLIDLSTGGVQFETPRLLRPDIDVVLEIIDSRTREVSQVVSRVLRAKVAGLSGGIRYRAACSFRRPLSHPTLLVPDVAPAPPPSPDYLKLELELKTIVERQFKQRRGFAGSDASTLLDALGHLRSAAERRRDSTDRQLGMLLAALIPLLERKDPVDAVLGTLHDQLAGLLPLIAIRSNAGDDDALAQDCERVTLNMARGANAPMSITAEFPAGFALDSSQFRLLKLSAYLVGLIENWNTHALPEVETTWMESDAQPATPPPVAAETEIHAGDLPFGWDRVVLRYLDGQILHGYSNDFYPDRVCFQFSPTIGCPAVERMLVPLARLKAVFFVKDLHGDPDRVDVQTFDHAPRGRKVQVTFRDGEVMIGSTLTYKPNGRGFFVEPARADGNNVRVYVVTAAIRHIKFI